MEKVPAPLGGTPSLLEVGVSVARGRSPSAAADVFKVEIGLGLGFLLGLGFTGGDGDASSDADADTAADALSTVGTAGTAAGAGFAHAARAAIATNAILHPACRKRTPTPPIMVAPLVFGARGIYRTLSRTG